MRNNKDFALKKNGYILTDCSDTECSGYERIMKMTYDKKYKDDDIFDFVVLCIRIMFIISLSYGNTSSLKWIVCITILNYVVALLRSNAISKAEWIKACTYNFYCEVVITLTFLLPIFVIIGVFPYLLLSFFTLSSFVVSEVTGLK